MSPEELISSIESLGGSLSIAGERIRAEWTPEAERLLPELRKIRDEVYRALQERAQDSGKVTAVEVEIPVACRCSKWAFPHIHSQDDRERAIREWNRDSKWKIQ